ncbi:MAG: hypothetical protein CW338_00630 [Clostridiales bacterium]|nr:hypothetical protein [Clostridiales bacterium]
MPEKRGRLTARGFLIDYLLSIGIELVILFALMGFCSLFIYRGALIGAEELVGSEMSSPTLGRLIYMILSFVLAAGLCVAASLCAKKGKDVFAFWAGFASGIFLWQAAGEEAWHFAVGGIHFVQLESIAAFPVVILFAGLIIYGWRRRAFDWGVWITLISFACNWIGHYVTVGLYPFVQDLTGSRAWNVGAGCAGGGIMFILSILYLLTHAGTRKGRMFASVLTYIAIGITALSVIDG